MFANDTTITIYVRNINELVDIMNDLDDIQTRNKVKYMGTQKE